MARGFFIRSSRNLINITWWWRFLVKCAFSTIRQSTSHVRKIWWHKSSSLIEATRRLASMSLMHTFAKNLLYGWKRFDSWHFGLILIAWLSSTDLTPTIFYVTRCVGLYLRCKVATSLFRRSKPTLFKKKQILIKRPFGPKMSGTGTEQSWWPVRLLWAERQNWQ